MIACELKLGVGRASKRPFRPFEGFEGFKRLQSRERSRLRQLPLRESLRILSGFASSQSTGQPTDYVHLFGIVTIAAKTL